jgi:hypothetical protein
LHFGWERKDGGFLRSQFNRIGAPRPMKMGTIVSPWRYDAATD